MKISKIDHIHVYVENIELAERWYQEVLGFARDDSLYFWLGSAWKTESMVTPVFATPILTISWLA